MRKLRNLYADLYTLSPEAAPRYEGAGIAFWQDRGYAYAKNLLTCIDVVNTRHTGLPERASRLHFLVTPYGWCRDCEGVYHVTVYGSIDFGTHSNASVSLVLSVALDGSCTAQFTLRHYAIASRVASPQDYIAIIPAHLHTHYTWALLYEQVYKSFSVLDPLS